jgi:hypothetical protein
MKPLLKAVQRTVVWRRLVRSLWAPLHARIWRRLQRPRAYSFKPQGDALASSAARLPASPVTKKVCFDILRLFEAGAFDSAKRAGTSPPSPVAFYADITGLLPVDIRREAIRIALEPDVLAWVMTYFGFAPHLHGVTLALNSTVSGLGEEGSKLWHRDNGDADGKQVKMFVVVTPIHTDNGPFYYLENTELTYHAHLPCQPAQPGEPWLQGRVSNEVVTRIGGRIHSLIGADTGDRLLIDTLTVYHKGGWCLGADRVILQLTFRADGYCSEKRQDLAKFLEWSPEQMAAHFPSELHRFILGLDADETTTRASDAARWLVFRLNRSVFTYLFAPSSSADR